jgi:hypothetical protein
VSHPPLESSQAFIIIQSGIPLHLGSQPGSQIRASSGEHSLILDPVLIRQVAMRHSQLLSSEAFDAHLGIRTGEAFFQILAETFRHFPSFDSTQSILFYKFIFEFTCHGSQNMISCAWKFSVRANICEFTRLTKRTEFQNLNRVPAVSFQCSLNREAWQLRHYFRLSRLAAVSHLTTGIRLLLYEQIL